MNLSPNPWCFELVNGAPQWRSLRGWRGKWAVALFGLWILVSHEFSVAQSPGGDPSPIRATVISREVVRVERSFVGTVTPIRQAVIGSAVDGRISDVFVDEGDEIRLDIALNSQDIESPEPGAESEEASDSTVRTNDEGRGVPLAQIRTATIDIELAAARSELELRLALEQELTRSLPSDLELARASMLAAEARHRYATSEWERLRGLSRTGAGLSASELDLALTTYEASTQDLAAARAAVLKLENTAEWRLAQAAAQVLNQKETVRLLEDRKSKYTVRAPFEGVVSRRMAEVGQWITTGQEVAEVVQMNPIDVVIMVPQNMLGDFQYSIAEAEKQTATEPSDEGSKNGGRPAESLAASNPSADSNEGRLLARISTDRNPEPWLGYVDSVVPKADLLSRSFPVKIRMENPRTRLGYRYNPGMLVKVQVNVGEVQQRLMVQKDALVLNNNGKYLMVIDRGAEPPTVRSVPVQLGAAVEDRVEVIGDIRDQDWVVVEGNERLRTGNPVKIINITELEGANRSNLSGNRLDPASNASAVAVGR